MISELRTETRHEESIVCLGSGRGRDIVELLETAGNNRLVAASMYVGDGSSINHSPVRRGWNRSGATDWRGKAIVIQC